MVSGYRSGIQTNLSVGVQLPDTTGTTIIPIGIASISEGHVTSVAITTDRVFYAPRDISNVLYDNITGILQLQLLQYMVYLVMKKLLFLESHLRVITLDLDQLISLTLSIIM